MWKKLRYLIEYVSVKALAVGIPRLPRKGCVVLGKVFGAVAFALDHRGRRVSIANIEAALGDEYSPEERYRIARESYQYFARTMLDLFWAPRLTEAASARWVRLVGREHLEALAGKPRVVVVAHVAGFEWSSLSCGLINLRGMTLTEAFKNPALDKVFTDLRSCTGQTIITQEMSMLRMLRQVMKGRLVGMLIDLNLPPTQAATVIDTFGLKMCATYLHAVLAQRAGARIVPVTAEVQADGSCDVEIHAPLEIREGAPGQEIAQQTWDFFEGRIRAKPERWMWAYKHWRFRPKGETRKYPFYANESGKFERLVKESRGNYE